MKRLFFLMLAVLAFQASKAQQADSLGYISLKPAEFRQQMDNSKNHLLIDVREFFEFRKSRIPHAVNIPSSGNIALAADTLEKGRDIFLYCTSGFRSRKAAKHFAGKGFGNIYSLDGGISGWRKEGMPTERKRLRRN